ncbi:MAG: sortase [Candidatus Dormibacteraeota bacterium]|nr:sortase [Candidatus Dormibacteraeota bacterium]
MPGGIRERQQVTVPSGGEPSAFLSIDALKLVHVPVYDRGLDSQRRMLIAPGYSVTHYVRSSPIGGGSNVVLYGHDDMEGEIFKDLSTLHDGDLIQLDRVNAARTSYRVKGGPTFVGANAVGILDQASKQKLTLFTCYPYLVDNQRVVIEAFPGGQQD